MLVLNYFTSGFNDSKIEEKTARLTAFSSPHKFSQKKDSMTQK